VIWVRVSTAPGGRKPGSSLRREFPQSWRTSTERKRAEDALQESARRTLAGYTFEYDGRVCRRSIGPRGQPAALRPSWQTAIACPEIVGRLRIPDLEEGQRGRLMTIISDGRRASAVCWTGPSAGEKIRGRNGRRSTSTGRFQRWLALDPNRSCQTKPSHRGGPEFGSEFAAGHG